MLDQQSKLSDIQTQLATGKRIASPSDDPIASAKSIGINQNISVAEQYQKNSDVVQSRLQLEDSTLENITLVINRVRELAIQGNNSSVTDNDRKLLASEAQQRLNELISLANTRDTNGEYIYSGFQSNNQPFSKLSTGGFLYSGDDGQRMIQISPSRTIALGDNGVDVFQKMLNGNGHFSVLDNPSNTGSGLIDGGSLTNGSSWVQDTYNITFITDTSFEVRDSGGGLVLASAYTEGSLISFNGVNTSIKGSPIAGDSFSLAPSINQDLFTTIENIINAFQSPTTGQGGAAKLHNGVNRFLNDIDQSLDVMHSIRSGVGVRLNSLETQKELNSSLIINNQSELSDLQDIDYIEAVSNLNLQRLGLESAQKTYMQIQGLSLFDYL